MTTITAMWNWLIWFWTSAWAFTMTYPWIIVLAAFIPAATLIVGIAHHRTTEDSSEER